MEDFVADLDMFEAIDDGQPVRIGITFNGSKIYAISEKGTILGIMEIYNTHSNTGIRLDTWVSAKGTKGVGTVMMTQLQQYAARIGSRITVSASGADGEVFGIEAKEVNHDKLKNTYEHFGFISIPGCTTIMVWDPKSFKEKE